MIVIFSSCSENKTAVIWTDRSEFALYGDFFNSLQNQYKVSVRYVEFPLSQLGKSDIPDIIVASYLKSSTMDTTFRSLNNILGKNNLSRDTFYPRLLTMGSINRTQYLLPVSFNIPALVFSKDREIGFSNQFTIDFEEIKKLSQPFNRMTRGAYTRLGFSPLWNDNFLLTTAILSRASFRENSPLAWDANALERSMVFINNWTNGINTSAQADDDFAYKYFIEPLERLIQSGRILFSYMESSNLFILNEDIKRHLDFRWIMERDMIPVTEDSVYLGIPKGAKSQKAARAFIQWFFQVENQRLILEYSQSYRINESIFGICGGFAALSPVTEQIYPIFYPELLGRMPPSENFTIHNILPGNWVAIKERVVLPYLHDRARVESAIQTNSLERRLSDWMRLNR
ncbi:MAG: hypothetical protein LBC80_07225 [Treponema sp.]|nr:hypothetical protein [Treponema sp.]